VAVVRLEELPWCKTGVHWRQSQEYEKAANDENEILEKELPAVFCHVRIVNGNPGD
jgi:hypothetical protein